MPSSVDGIIAGGQCGKSALGFECRRLHGVDGIMAD